MSQNLSRTQTPLDPADANVMDLFRLDGTVAVVTGAGRGIGRGIALGMADAGADVVITARRENELDEVAAQIAKRGRKAIKVVADITAAETIPTLVDTAMSTFGRIDTWVSNAGTSDHPGNFSFDEFPEWHWDNQHRIELAPALRCFARMFSNHEAWLMPDRYFFHCRFESCCELQCVWFS